MNGELKKYSHFDLLFPSDYLKAGDLGGRDVVLTIKDIEPRHKLKTTDGKAQAKPLIHFAEANTKPMVLNKTNAKVLRKLYGSEATAWIDRRVALYSAEVEAFGDVVDAIRFRKSVPKGAARGAPPEAAAGNIDPAVTQQVDGDGAALEESPLANIVVAEAVALIEKMGRNCSALALARLDLVARLDTRSAVTDAAAGKLAEIKAFQDKPIEQNEKKGLDW